MLTSTQLVVGAVTVEVVALAEFATVDLRRVFPLLAFTCTTDTVTVIAADIRTVVFSAVSIQVFCPHFVFAALTKTSNSSFIAPNREINFYQKNVLCSGTF